MGRIAGLAADMGMDMAAVAEIGGALVAEISAAPVVAGSGFVAAVGSAVVALERWKQLGVLEIPPQKVVFLRSILGQV